MPLQAISLCCGLCFLKKKKKSKLSVSRKARLDPVQVGAQRRAPPRQHVHRITSDDRHYIRNAEIRAWKSVISPPLLSFLSARPDCSHSNLIVTFLVLHLCSRLPTFVLSFPLSPWTLRRLPSTPSTPRFDFQPETDRLVTFPVGFIQRFWVLGFFFLHLVL